MFSWLSFSRNKHFIRNLIIAIGVVLVWRWVWNLADIYLLPNNPLASSIISLVIGILILYFPDGTLEHLGGHKEQEPIETIIQSQKPRIIIGIFVLLIITIILISSLLLSQ